LGSQAAVSNAANSAIAVGARSTVDADNAVAIGSLASAIAANSVALGAGSVANVENTVSVGSASNQRRITNVAAPVGATDAANKAYVDARVASVSGGTGSGGPSYVAADTAAGAPSAAGSEALAVGGGASAGGAGATAIGNGAGAAGNYATAIGQGVKAGQQLGTAIGYGAAAGELSAAIGATATGSGNSAVAIGYNSAATNVASTAIGQGASATGLLAAAVGQASTASKDSSAAYGARSAATGLYSTAVGGDATAAGYAATAVGNGAQAVHANSTAVGTGAKTTADNQLMLGNSGTAVVVAGIGASTDAQVGPVDVVTVDANGTLGRQRAASAQSVQEVRTSIDYIAAVTDAQFGALAGDVQALGGRVGALEQQMVLLDDKIASSTAAAVAMGGAVFLPGQKFNMTANVATYDGAHAGSFQVGALLSDHVAVNAGLGTGLNKNGKTAGRVGVTLGF
jgi:hypothetical protein